VLEVDRDALARIEIAVRVELAGRMRGRID